MEMGLPNDQNDREVYDEYANGADSAAGHEITQGEASDVQLERNLLVSGLIFPVAGSEDGVEIQRGMKILTSEGETAGVVAGILHNRTPYRAEYILLSRPSQQLEYRMVPVELIEQVSKEKVMLHVAAPVVNTLRSWHN